MHLDQVNTGLRQKPHLVLLYGPDGCGKSTWAASAPNPIFLGSEDGTSYLDVARLPSPKSWEHVAEMVHELTTADHKYKTLVIDSLDWLEPHVWEWVCKDAGVEFIELAYKGYGKGFTKAIDQWRLLMKKITELQTVKKMNVIVIAHAQIKPFADPQANASYDRYILKLNEKASALWREYVDCVLFANYETLTHKEKGDKKSKAFGDGKRVLYTERRPAFDAKNRQGLPFELPLSWEDYVNACVKKAPEDVETLLKNIEGLLHNVSDKKIVEKVRSAIETAKTDALKLSKIQDRLRTLANA